MSHLELSMDPPAAIYRECEAAGLKDITLETYNVVSQDPHRIQVTRRWLMRAMRGIIPSFIFRSGQAESKDVAARVTEELLQRYDLECDNGAVPVMEIKTIVAQKP